MLLNRRPVTVIEQLVAFPHRNTPHGFRGKYAEYAESCYIYRRKGYRCFFDSQREYKSVIPLLNFRSQLSVNPRQHVQTTHL